MSDFRVGVCIPVGPNREANLRDTLASLDAQTRQPERVVVVLDGPETFEQAMDLPTTIPSCVVPVPKHHPGLEQPRNAGVRAVADFGVPLTHVWFVDSDVVLAPNALQAFADAHAMHTHESHILVGPYDFMPPGMRGYQPEVRADMRWNSFDHHGPEEITHHPLAGGQACFSGNLVWNIEHFQRLGGYWNDLYHGRCEDGEFGIRATMSGDDSPGVVFVRDARGSHQWHPINHEWVAMVNRRDVPMINKRHPFMPDAQTMVDPRAGDQLLMTAKDGIRFDFRCHECGGRFNSLSYWEHCGGRDWKCPDACG